ncbi:MAG: LysM peptidoglycan-binding domain-containing protein [Gammaproteobacteria bacterium]|nr:LysM peptidoglycan-binding domain-containing protein [Gammaproteobacteria bacterium]
MITNKRLGLHLLPLLAFALLGLGCSVFEKSPQPEAEQQPTSPPPKQEQAQQPEAPVVSAAETPPPMPAASPLRPGVPERYTVKKGDTLWDIAKHFLNDPWLWPEIWYVNPAIRNPHLIYPGDVIALTWVNGKPVLTLEGAEAAPPPPSEPSLKVEKMSPSIRVEKLGKAITTLPKSAIAPFLYRPFFITDDQLAHAPYVIANYGNHVISGTGDRIYSEGIETAAANQFNVVRKGATYRDPDTGEILGYEAINLGEARLVRLGNPQTLDVTKAYKEILVGDYLLPKETEEIELNFYPRAPKKDIAGRIISVADGVAKIGQYNVIVINKGAEDGLEPGHVLEIYQAGDTVRAPYSHKRIKLPEERAGIAMVFKTYKTVSYALVMEAYKDLKVLDYVYSP